MPRKKASQQADSDPSAQPLKRFKADSGSSNVDEPTERRSLRNRPQDENKADCNVITRSTRASAKQHVQEISPSRPKRNALHNTEERVTTRGAGFVMKTPSAKPVASCPLEVAVHVTPCDLSDKMDKATVAEPTSRKRKVKVSPKAEEKKLKTISPKSHNSTSTARQSTESLSRSPPVHSLRECSVQLVLDTKSLLADSLTKYSTILAKSENCVNQDGLPQELPSKSADPVFTRRVMMSSMSEGVASNGEFSVLTYNILSECVRVKCDYTYSDKLHLNMDYRGYRIIEEIKHFDSDIVCLQEVDEEYYHDTLKKHMQMLGYEGIYLKRGVDGLPEGESTFYKTSQFKFKECHEFSYSALAYQDIERLEHSQEIKDLIWQYVNRPAVLLVSTLTHKLSGRDLVIGNTHLTWTKFIDIDVPCMQASYAFKVMDRLSNHGEIPFILCGDFNTRNTDPGYQLAAEGYLNDSSLETLQSLHSITLPDGSRRSLVDLLWCGFQHPARNITSSYLTVQGEEPEITSRNCVMDNAVDYLWTSQLNTLSVTEVNRLGHLMPNIIYPSDHVSLQSTYSFYQTDEAQ